MGSHDCNPRIASGVTIFPTLSASMGDKQWLGNQEAFSGNYHILEDTMQEVWSVDSISSNSMKSRSVDRELSHPRGQVICFLERAGCEGGGKGILCSEEKTFTLSTVDNMRICKMEEISTFDMKQHHNPQPTDTFQLTTGNCSTIRGDTPLVLMDQGGGVMNIEYDKTGTLRRETHGHEPIVMEEKVMAFAQNTRDEVRYQNGDGQIVGALAAQPGMKQTTYIKSNTVVRRLTPVECERLQGFPDNYTNIPWRGKDTSPDSRRYKALGNSMAVPVMHWIGKMMMDAKEVIHDEAAIDRILYVTPSDDGQLSLF